MPNVVALIAEHQTLSYRRQLLENNLEAHGRTHDCPLRCRERRKIRADLKHVQDELAVWMERASVALNR